MRDEHSRVKTHRNTLPSSPPIMMTMMMLRVLLIQHKMWFFTFLLSYTLHSLQMLLFSTPLHSLSLYFVLPSSSTGLPLSLSLPPSSIHFSLKFSYPTSRDPRISFFLISTFLYKSFLLNPLNHHHRHSDGRRRRRRQRRNSKLMEQNGERFKRCNCTQRSGEIFQTRSSK